jgi:hypothetical protein
VKFLFLLNVKNDTGLLTYSSRDIKAPGNEPGRTGYYESPSRWTSYVLQEPRSFRLVKNRFRIRLPPKVAPPVNPSPGPKALWPGEES